jgi:SAM-dependent methyltransferase
MTRHLRLREFLVAVEGLALFRHLFEDDDAEAAARIDEVRRIVNDESYAGGVDVPELDARAGYAAWSETYDGGGNPLISVEEPAVRSVLAELEPGRALDAACGTGRHAGYLADRGHDVVGVDASPEMLAHATARSRRAWFVQGDLERLPLATGAVDLAVCSLALGHLVDLTGPVMELARVVRPGGRVVLSDLHPVMRLNGGQAFFNTAAGASAFVREHRHLHGDYLRAFAEAGLEVRRCLEPGMGDSEVAMQGIANAFVPEATRAAFLGIPEALIWDLARR